MTGTQRAAPTRVAPWWAARSRCVWRSWTGSCPTCTQCGQSVGGRAVWPSPGQSSQSAQR
eukprot:292378-Chlamydomonas_euryale.AAC.1